MKEIIVRNDDLVIDIDGIKLNKTQLKRILTENVVMKRQLAFVQTSIADICGDAE